MTQGQSVTPDAMPGTPVMPLSNAPHPAAPALPPPPTPGAEPDRRLHSLQARLTGGQSPSTMGLAFMDWAAHAANDPVRAGELLREAFALTSGGHNAGIVSKPGHRNRHFRIRTREAGARTPGTVERARDIVPQDGSWWPQWGGAWLARHSGRDAAPPPMGTALCDAPGTYVVES